VFALPLGSLHFTAPKEGARPTAQEPLLDALGSAVLEPVHGALAIAECIRSAAPRRELAWTTGGKERERARTTISNAFDVRVSLTGCA
jgi:hypothetical protein